MNISEKNCIEKIDEGYFLETDVQYPKTLHGHPFSPGRMEIEKLEKLGNNFHDKAEYVIHMRNIN